ncbi:hypothetical protein JL720_15954 [Aureococcus anophagefferens]|nr:hypothetical protein JL720_15954 [Aureococcus anophagefferens]
MAALWVARLLPLVAASRPSADVAAPPAEADSPAWRRLVEAWSRRRLDAGDDACEHAECWSCPTASSCEAAGCFYEAEFDYCGETCSETACWSCRAADECDAAGSGWRACRASETCELYEGDPALLGASFACARPDACVPYYACANCDEDLCAVGYVPGCKLSADAKTCEADDAALACSNLCDAAPGCAFGDACGKDEAYYGCGAQACGPASCALCATASACDAVPGCASQSLPGAGDLCAVDLAAGFLAPACSRDACYACDVAACAATPGCAYDDQTGACGFDCGADGGGVVFESDARSCYALVLRGAWQDRALAVFDGAAALVAAGEKRTSAHVRDDLCLGDGCYRVDVSGGRPGVFAPCFWTLGPAFAGAAPADADAFWRTTVSCEEPRSFVALEAGTASLAASPDGGACDGVWAPMEMWDLWGDGWGETYEIRGERGAVGSGGLESGASAVDFHCLELDVCYSLTVSGDGPSPEEVHWQLGRVEGRAGFRDTFSLPASPAWSGDVALGCEAPFAAASPAPSAALPEPSARFSARDALAGSRRRRRCSTATSTRRRRSRWRP